MLYSSKSIFYIYFPRLVTDQTNPKYLSFLVLGKKHKVSFGGKEPMEVKGTCCGVCCCPGTFF